MSMQALQLIPTWTERRAQQFMLPVSYERTLAVGATSRDFSLLKEQCPNALLLSVQADEAVAVLAARLQQAGRFEHVVWLAEPLPAIALLDDELIHAQQRGVLSCYRLVRALLQADYAARPLALTVITRQAQAVHEGDAIAPAHASVHGLIGAVAREYAHWRVRVVDVEWQAACPFAAIFRLPAEPAGDVWAFRHGAWYQRELVPCEAASEAASHCREGGVYVVIGGAGGLGEVWTEHVIRRQRAQVIWVGRRELDDEIRAKQARLGRIGPAPDYISADARDLASLRAAHEQIRRRHGSVSGLVHAAILLRDATVAGMSEERFAAALSAKVDVSVRMMQVFGEEPLEFILFFSSLMSFGKAAGQSNYSAGCAFKDAYAQALARERPGKVKTLNWGFWGSVGVVASQAYRARMLNFGLGSIEPAEGMAALEVLLQGPMQQMAYLKAATESIEQVLRIATNESIAACSGRELRPAASPAEREVPPHIVHELAPQSLRELDCLLLNLLHRSLDSLGLNGSRPPAVAPQYQPWLEQSLRMLREHESSVRTDDPAAVPWSSAEELEVMRRRYAEEEVQRPALVAQLALVERMLQSLGDILSGRRWAVEVLFPAGSIGSMAQKYQQSPVVDYFNAALGDALLAYLQRLPPGDAGAGIRILEIGAGTGTSTAPLLQRLSPYQQQIQEYSYTDISPAFLRHGRREYSQHASFLQFELFDVERPPREQSLAIGQYDVVIAANVLHATRNIRRTLRHAKALLRRNGLLLLNEIVANSLIAHLTFGLTPGWWLAEDPQLRLRGGPGLTIESWRRVLWEEGFTAVEFPTVQARQAGMQIITAASDGLVRQAKRVIAERSAVLRSAVEE